MFELSDKGWDKRTQPNTSARRCSWLREAYLQSELPRSNAWWVDRLHRGMRIIIYKVGYASTGHFNEQSYHKWGRPQSILAIISNRPRPCDQGAARETLGGSGENWYESVHGNRGALWWATFLYARPWIIFLGAFLDLHSLQRIRREQGTA